MIFFLNYYIGPRELRELPETSGFLGNLELEDLRLFF